MRFSWIVVTLCGLSGQSPATDVVEPFDEVIGIAVASSSPLSPPASLTFLRPPVVGGPLASAALDSLPFQNVSTTAALRAPRPGTKKPGKDKEAALQPYLRWLWWVVVVYFFWAQALVCDEYFVPTIEVISDTLQIPDDIAGATIMALGCNGPELFINTVAILPGFESDLGIGAVLGGEVFNLLILTGCALVATPAMYMPLRISKFSFTRDVTFYAISIGLIYWVLYDNNVTLFNAIVLLCGGVCYSSFVGFSSGMRRCFHKAVNRGQSFQPEDRTRQSSGSAGILPKRDEDDEDTSETDGQFGPEDGCFLGVRVQMGNRMQDRSRHWDTRFVTLSRNGLVVSTDVRDNKRDRFGRTGRGIVFQHDSEGVGHWVHGGIVNAPTVEKVPQRRQSLTGSHIQLEIDGGERRERVPSASGDLTGDLPRASSNPDLGAFEELRTETIPFIDVVRCVAPLNPTLTHFELQVLQRGNALGKVITVDLDAKSVEMRDRWIMAIKLGMDAVIRLTEHQRRGDLSAASLGHETAVTIGPSSPPVTPLWMEVVDWCRFPVTFLLKVTIPDVKDEKYRKWVPLSFAMSMCWLACFSFCVVQICDILSDEFNISVTILGFTVAAIGTSFPNVISCIAVSRQGKTGMAIANALGANIQNVFIALAVPWFFKTVSGGPFAVSTGDLTASIIAMVVTLGMLVIVVLLAGCKFHFWSGVTFLVIYAIYLIMQFGQEAFCVTFPFCSGATSKTTTSTMP